MQKGLNCHFTLLKCIFERAIRGWPDFLYGSGYHEPDGGVSLNFSRIVVEDEETHLYQQLFDDTKRE